MLCAILLLIVDWRDRYLHRRNLNSDDGKKKKKKNRRNSDDIQRNETSSNTTGGGCSREDDNNAMMIAPMPSDDPVNLTDIPMMLAPLSRVSSMTNSLVDGLPLMVDEEDELRVAERRGNKLVVPLEQQLNGGNYYRNGKATTALSKDSPSRSPKSYSLATVSEYGASPSSCRRQQRHLSASSSPASLPALRGESLIMVTPPCKGKQENSVENSGERMLELELSPDSVEEARDAIEQRLVESLQEERDGSVSSEHRRELSRQLEHVLSKIPVSDEELSSARKVFDSTLELLEDEYIRDIYFVPVKGTGRTACDEGLGMEIGASYVADCGFGAAQGQKDYPCIVAISSGSPLAGRVFEGDSILRINDMDTINFEDPPQKVLQLIRESTGTSAVKLTVLSAHRDGASDTTAGDDCYRDEALAYSVPDLGLENTAVEV